MPVADRHVAALTVLADVVQERAQQHAVPIMDAVDRHDLDGILVVGRRSSATTCARTPR